MTDLAYMSIIEARPACCSNARSHPVELTLTCSTASTASTSICTATAPSLPTEHWHRRAVWKRTHRAANTGASCMASPSQSKTWSTQRESPHLVAPCSWMAGRRTDDATAMGRLDAAGAVLLGKLHMTEFALRWHHPGPGLHRSIPVLTAGRGFFQRFGGGYGRGSLSTSLRAQTRASRTASRLRAMAQSASNPPTAGSAATVSSPWPNLWTNAGPITLRVADAAAMLGVIAGHDPKYPTSSHQAVPDYVSLLRQDVSGLRMGIDERFLSEGVHPECA